MARALRVEFEGAIYHVTARGNERGAIFRDDGDRVRFVAKLSENVESHGIRLYAYVLMGNHYHLLVETPRANLSAFMQQFNTGYTVFYNKRHGRNGHLFEGRYKAKVVDGDPYLLSLTRYIHLNPVKVSVLRDLPLAEKQKRLCNYAWSSFRAYAGMAAREAFVDYGPLLALVSSGATAPEAAYRGYVEAGLAQADEDLQEALMRSSKAIGREGFCLRMEKEYGNRVQRAGQKLDASMRKMEVGIAPEFVFDQVCRHFCVSEESLRMRRNTDISRIIAMKLLKDCSGLNHRNIAALLGIGDGSGISRSISNLNNRMEKDQQLLNTYNALRHEITNQGLTPDEF